jgi:hypothetical protein
MTQERERRLPANFNGMEALENWVRAELEILRAEKYGAEDVVVREELLEEMLGRIGALRSREVAADLDKPPSTQPNPEQVQ